MAYTKEIREAIDSVKRVSKKAFKLVKKIKAKKKTKTLDEMIENSLHK